MSEIYEFPVSGSVAGCEISARRMPTQFAGLLAVGTPLCSARYFALLVEASISCVDDRFCSAGCELWLIFFSEWGQEICFEIIFICGISATILSSSHSCNARAFGNDS
jgi:hypothetical protein